MQPTDTLTTLFSHNRWANLRLLETCAGLSGRSPEPLQLAATVPGTYGTIHDTLQHIVVAERLYLSLISTGQRYDRPQGAPPLTLAEMAEWARLSGEGLIEWAPKVQPGDTFLDEGVWEIPKTILLTQAINHATEHRAQVMTILTQLGIQPPELDGWTYITELGK